jgi:PAS domain S-box-containing protein
MSVPPTPAFSSEEPSRLQARLAGILEVALDCIVTIDSDGCFIDFNPAAERTFGYQRDEVIGRKMSDLIVPPALRERHDNGLRRLASGGAPHMLGQRIEITAQRRDGTEFPVELAITRIVLGPEVPPVYTAHMRDITERKQTEEALLSLQQQLQERIEQRTAALQASEASLRESQELFARSFHANPALMWIAELPEGQLLEVNASFERAFGRPKAELLGRTTLELDLWPDPTRREQFIQQLRDGPHVRDFEASFQCVNGPRTFLLSADRIDVSGTRALLVVATDISERRRREDVEAALARAEASYRSIFENALEGLYRSTPDGRFLEANPALARMLGYGSPAELMSSVNDIGAAVYVDPRRRQTFFDLLGWHDRVVDFESEVCRQDGTTIWVSESVSAVRDADGNLLYLEGVATNITAQREAALALAEAKEAADAANRAKSQFLASMSHELRTPLNGILGYTQILARDTLLNPPQKRGVEVIHQSAEHLLSLINDVLDLSKIEAGRLELHATTCDLRNLLAGVVDLLTPRAHSQNLGFATDFSPDLPRFVQVDAGRLRQILLNLLGNALKFTRDGSVLFSTHARPAATPGATAVMFSVSDTGPGIDPEDMDRLFQPFVQLSRSGPSAEGTGLGLAITRRLVQLLGGELQVESKPGWGSRFWFELHLPLAEQPAAALVSPRRRLSGYSGPRRELLVVDDHPANREVLVHLLQEVGFEIRVAASGEEALLACGFRRPAAVLLDLRMEGMSGLETATWLRQQHGDAFRIIAVSASAYDLDREACRTAGCDDFLAKPVRAEELWDMLGRHLQLEWVYAEPAPPTHGTVVPFIATTAVPPAAVLQVLHDLARTGDIVALRSRAEALAAEQPECADFVARILTLVDQFKLKAVRQLIAPLLPNTQPSAAT